MINHDLSVYKTSQAPPPETLYWSNIRWRAWERSLRSNLIWVAFWALAIFYVRCTAPPTAQLEEAVLRPPYIAVMQNLSSL